MWDLILVLDYDPKVPLCVHAGSKEALSKEVSLQKKTSFLLMITSENCTKKKSGRLTCLIGHALDTG